MTPAFARSVYYAALGRAYIDKHLDWTKSVVQHECEMIAWRAVVETEQTPEIEAALKAYQDAKADLRTTPHTIDRLWGEYCRLVREAMEKKSEVK